MISKITVKLGINLRKSELNDFRHIQLSADCTNRYVTLAVICMPGSEWAGWFSITDLEGLCADWPPWCGIIMVGP